MRVLIGYAGEHGSTQVVAERITARLRERGLATRLAPLADRPPLAGHDAFVLGSAVHNGAWMPAAADFVSRNRRELSGRPVWMFSVGMSAALPRPLRRLADRSEQKPILRLRSLLGPRGYRRFSGVIRPAHLDRTGRVIFRLLGCRYGDFRDWRAIDTWAEDIARTLSGRAGNGG